MTDRVSKYPGKYKMTRDDGSVEYVTFERADEPTVVGSLYNRTNVLPAEVCTALGLTAATAEPKDAFTALAAEVKKIGGQMVAGSKQFIKASSTWTAPTTGWYWIEAIGGGATAYSSGANAAYAAGGGGYDARALKYNKGATVAVTIGAAGAKNPSVNPGNPGGMTKFGDLLVAGGGKCDSYTAAGGTGSAGDLHLSGGTGVVFSCPDGQVMSIAGGGPMGYGVGAVVKGSTVQPAHGYGAAGVMSSTGTPGLVIVTYIGDTWTGW